MARGVFLIAGPCGGRAGFNECVSHIFFFKNYLFSSKKVLGVRGESVQLLLEDFFVVCCVRLYVIMCIITCGENFGYLFRCCQFPVPRRKGKEKHAHQFPRKNRKRERNACNRLKGGGEKRNALLLFANMFFCGEECFSGQKNNWGTCTP